MRALYHIGFWLSFILLFFYQNPSGTLDDYMTWFWVLFIVAIVVYSNLYFLLLRFFFQKKYVQYGLFLLLTIVLGSYVISLVLNSDNEFLRNDFIQNFINLSLFIIITSTFKFYREYQQKQTRLIRVENEQLKTELKLLKSQVNPHFLFNTLSNLYGLIIQNHNQEAAEVTLKISDLMRYLLQSSKAEKVKLSEEIQFLEDYLSLEKIRLSQNANIFFELSGTNTGEAIAPLLFIPLVENAFKHGLQSLTQNCYAHFTLTKEGNEIYFEAKNSKGKHLTLTPSGTGLNNLKKRLDLIYPDKHILEIEQDKTYFRVSLQITL